MIKACLQVRSSDRPTCDKILAMPGLLNHLTGTLNDLQSLCAENESLLKTIKLPKRMGEITERMPASQYDVESKSSESRNDLKSIKRTNSLPNYHIS